MDSKHDKNRLNWAKHQIYLVEIQHSHKRILSRVGEVHFQFQMNVVQSLHVEN